MIGRGWRGWGVGGEIPLHVFGHFMFPIFHFFKSDPGCQDTSTWTNTQRGRMVRTFSVSCEYVHSDVVGRRNFWNQVHIFYQSRDGQKPNLFYCDIHVASDDVGFLCDEKTCDVVGWCTPFHEQDQYIYVWLFALLVSSERRRDAN